MTTIRNLMGGAALALLAACGGGGDGAGTPPAGSGGAPTPSASGDSDAFLAAVKSNIALADPNDSGGNITPTAATESAEAQDVDAVAEGSSEVAEPQPVS